MMELDQYDEDNYKPRSYQDQLLACALKENVIIYLPTGSGKTFIALMAMREMSKALIGTLAEGGKRTVFLCNTIALAKQQYEVIKNFTNLKCGVFTGDMDVDNWKRDKWENELDKYQVFVATCQIIVDIIRHKFISVTNFNLMIFDECHHATGGHPMHQLMGQFQHYNPKELPRVIGLTGLLIKSSSRHKIVKELDDLEAVFRAKIVTVANFDEFKNVLIYSTKPTEVVVKYSGAQQKSYLIDKVSLLINEVCNKIATWKVDELHEKLSKNMGSIRTANPIKKMINLLRDFLYQLNDMGIYAGSVAIMAVLVEVELKKRAAETIIYRNMLRIIINYIERVRHILVDQLYDKDDEDENECDVILQSSTPKLQQLLLYMKKIFSDKSSNDIKCLLFVERRHTAKILYHVLLRYLQCDQTIPIKPDFMVGCSESMPESIEFILDEKWNRNVLNNFKRNQCNLIVASSVLEEGIDIQSCNYVIVFDEIKGFRSYVQTKGRARMEQSIYSIMIPDNKQSELLAKINEYKEMDRILKEFLIGKTIDRTIPLLKETSSQFEEVIPPFETSIGARLEAESCVPLLNRYCMELPSDSFTSSGVVYLKDNEACIDNKFVVKAVLPLQSTIKQDILSDAMENCKWAKRSAAFKACKLLYEKGEFSDHLLPITKKKCLELMTPVYFKHWENFDEDVPRIVGTNKKRRLYNIEYPSALKSALPMVGIESYMYVINLKPNFVQTDDNTHVYDQLITKNNFAILSSKTLPKLAEMPLFMTQGTLTAKISSYAISIILTTQEELNKLRNFHIMIFRDLLQSAWSRYFAQDHRNEMNSFLIVPTNSENHINWNLVNSFQNLSHVRKTSELQRRKMVIREEDYLKNIVCSWYTADDKVRYIVGKIRNDLTPLSPFPTSQHSSYAGYIVDKYDEQVVQTNSFMIEVQPLTSRTNFLIGGKADGSRKKTKKFDKILLIPELCHNFQFPGDFWLKSRFLPSILHRLHYLLIAEEIRNDLNRYLNVVHDNYNPSPLIIDHSLSRVSAEDVKTKDVIKLPSLISDISPQPLQPSSSLVDTNKYKWKGYEEPCDITRHVDQLHKIEIDYYYQFITNKFQTLNLSENFISQFKIINIKDSVRYNDFNNTNQKAICNTPMYDLKRINILYIPENNSFGPEQYDLLAAITTAGANDVFDMERLEVLGDSFLKFSISLFLLHRHPAWNEGYLTMVKGQLVSNRNLLYLAINKKIPGAIKSRQFNVQSEWRAPLVSVPLNALESINTSIISPSVFGELDLDDDEISTGQLKIETMTRFQKAFDNHLIRLNEESDMCFLIDQVWVSDKVCADVVEAILGVCVKTYGIKKTFRVLQYFNICSPELDMQNLLNINLGNPRVRTDITDSEIDAFLLNYTELEKNLGYTFKDRAYLLQALTHPSYPTNRITGCYQQLEFVGDAILDFLVTCYIFERCEYMDPGKLTDLRSALVNNVTLACIAVRHKFHLFLLYQNAALSESIMKFYVFQETQNFKVSDQVRVLILENEKVSTMADYVDVPKTLGDIFEALIGAVFLDSGNDLNKTWNVIYHLIEKELFEFMKNVPIQVVRQLYEYHGAEPTFSEPVVDDDIVMVSCSFTCRNEKRVVNGFGKNKISAKTSASKLALQHLLQA